MDGIIPDNKWSVILLLHPKAWLTSLPTIPSRITPGGLIFPPWRLRARFDLVSYDLDCDILFVSRFVARTVLILAFRWTGEVRFEGQAAGSSQPHPDDFRPVHELSRGQSIDALQRAISKLTTDQQHKLLTSLRNPGTFLPSLPRFFFQFPVVNDLGIGPVWLSFRPANIATPVVE
jgi:hypothetical protein